MSERDRAKTHPSRFHPSTHSSHQPSYRRPRARRPPRHTRCPTRYTRLRGVGGGARCRCGFRSGSGSEGLAEGARRFICARSICATHLGFGYTTVPCPEGSPPLEACSGRGSRSCGVDGSAVLLARGVRRVWMAVRCCWRGARRGAARRGAGMGLGVIRVAAAHPGGPF